MATPATVRRVDVVEIVDNSRIGRFQIGLFVLCAACLIMDGFDMQAIGYVAPALVPEWGIAPSSLGPVFGAGNTGVLFGWLLFTMLGDKIGRRPVLIAATLFFSVMTFATGLANSVEQLLVLRFIGGFGMGCIIPNG